MSITIRDIAKHCGVGVGTVSRAINDSGYVKEDTKKEILKYSKEQGWQASSLASSLKTGKTKTVALLANTITHPSNAEALEQIIVKLRNKGYHSFMSVGRDPQFAKSELKSYLNRKIEAAVIIVPNKEVADEIKQLRKAGTRIIALWSGYNCADFINLRSDYRIMAYNAIKRLADSGHKQIAYFGYLGKSCKAKTVDDFPTSRSYKDCLKGVLDAAEEFGIHMDLNKDVVSDNFRDYSQFEKLLLSRRHTAFICQGAPLQVEFYHCCVKHKIIIPDDVSTICMTSDAAFKGFNPPPEHFKYNFDKITDLTIEMIVAKTFNPGSDILEPKVLVPGKSIKKINKILQ